MIIGICSKEELNPRKEFTFSLFNKDSDSNYLRLKKTIFLSQSKEKISKTNQYIGVWKDKELCVAFQGHIFNMQKIIKYFRYDPDIPLSSLVVDLYRKYGIKIFNKFNGHFAIAIFDQAMKKLVLVRDHFGVEPLYYYLDNHFILFSSDPLFLLKNKLIPREINHKGLYTYLLFNYIPTKESIVSNLFKIRPAHSLIWQNGEVKENRYWYLSFKQEDNKEESYYTENILQLLNDAIALRVENDGEKPGAFLSGGMDSSSIVGLSSPVLKQKMHTFSFRCKGESFDESHYAKFMADSYKTDHHLVEFPHEATRSIVDLTEIMPEPFCDIGIEIASYLLAQYAQNKVDYILSGDGGDELFAGHPVYIADNVAKYFNRVPRFIQRPIIGALQWLPDTDKKKSLPVKAKRFSYSFQFPSELFSNRWRIYYTEKELQHAVNPEIWEHIKDQNPFSEIAAYYQEADGTDFLSKTLYGDYATVVNFYLTRMSILRHFGIEAKFPMFDHRLVAFVAKMPSDLKIKGNNDTKYILKKAMTGVLPDEIVFRTDKLGHSVPMKNWMRESPALTNLIRDVLSEDQIKKRGFFAPQFVRKMIDDHQAKKVNHSHRIWALMVLELWLQKHLD